MNDIFDRDLGRRVSRAYGAWYIEAMDSHGGWIASAVDMVRFAAAFDQGRKSPLLKTAMVAEMFARPPAPVARDEKGDETDVYYGLGWSVRVRSGDGGQNQWHTGSLDGTSTLLVRRHDGINWAVLFNTRKQCAGKNPASTIDPLVHQAVDAVKEWPAHDLFPRFLATGE